MVFTVASRIPRSRMRDRLGGSISQDLGLDGAADAEHLQLGDVAGPLLQPLVGNALDAR